MLSDRVAPAPSACATPSSSAGSVLRRVTLPARQLPHCSWRCLVPRRVERGSVRLRELLRRRRAGARAGSLAEKLMGTLSLHASYWPAGRGVTGSGSRRRRRSSRAGASDTCRCASSSGSGRGWRVAVTFIVAASARRFGDFATVAGIRTRAAAGLVGELHPVSRAGFAPSAGAIDVPTRRQRRQARLHRLRLLDRWRACCCGSTRSR